MGKKSSSLFGIERNEKEVHVCRRNECWRFSNICKCIYFDSKHLTCRAGMQTKNDFEEEMMLILL